MQSPVLKGRLVIASLLCGITLCAEADAPGVALGTSAELVKNCNAMRRVDPAASDTIRCSSTSPSAARSEKRLWSRR